jgi:plasmid maintenance system antidote protein VapI
MVELTRGYRKHPGGILNFMRIRLDIAMVEGAAIMHVNLVVIFQVIHQVWNVTSNCAFRSSIWTAIRPILAL